MYDIEKLRRNFPHTSISKAVVKGKFEIRALFSWLCSGAVLRFDCRFGRLATGKADSEQ